MTASALTLSKMTSTRPFRCFVISALNVLIQVAGHRLDKDPMHILQRHIGDGFGWRGAGAARALEAAVTATPDEPASARTFKAVSLQPTARRHAVLLFTGHR
jgi:hypothetical protein